MRKLKRKASSTEADLCTFSIWDSSWGNMVRNFESLWSCGRFQGPKFLLLRLICESFCPGTYNPVYMYQHTNANYSQDPFILDHMNAAQLHTDNLWLPLVILVSEINSGSSKVSTDLLTSICTLHRWPERRNKSCLCQTEMKQAKIADILLSLKCARSRFI